MYQKNDMPIWQDARTSFTKCTGQIAVVLGPIEYIMYENTIRCHQDYKVAFNRSMPKCIMLFEKGNRGLPQRTKLSCSRFDIFESVV